MFDNMELIDEEIAFPLPDDWQSASDMIYNSMKAGVTDYCYSYLVFKNVKERCEKDRINFVYVKHEDEEDDFNYYQLMPALFLDKDTYLPYTRVNYQIEMKDVPEDMCFKSGRYYYDAHGRLKLYS